MRAFDNMPVAYCQPESQNLAFCEPKFDGDEEAQGTLDKKTTPTTLGECCKQSKIKFPYLLEN